MKRIRKVFAAAFALVMVLAMGMSVSAANITIDDNGVTGAEYAAYRLLDATQSGTENKFAYTGNSKYQEALKAVTKLSTDQEIVNAIQKMDTDEIRTFADSMYKEITSKSIEADAVATDKKFENAAQGYYLIVETKTGEAGDTYSLVMLDTAGNEDVTVKTKEDVPELKKKVMEKNDSTGKLTEWQDGADYDLGDQVPFQLTGKLPSNYANYETYFYAFHDTLSRGLTLDPDSIVIKVDDTVLSDNYTIVTSGLEDGCSFEVKFEDLKKITTINATSVITVEYNAELNNQAVIGSEGNPNIAKLEYSSNPYGEEKGTTPEDKVIVFTYQINANKIGEDKQPLAGAGFTLQKFIASESGSEVYGTTKGTWTKIGNEITDVTTFEFKGQDAGVYRLVESTVPVGYNKADDIEFVVAATYDTDEEDPKLLTLNVTDSDGNIISGDNLTFKTTVAEGLISTDVINKTGVKLPSTGGIGTKIFYTVGAILMIGAAVILITRKRAKK